MDRTKGANYRPWLDGVRAVAIALVVLEHARIAQLANIPLGSAGVGIFFALSGYLITGLLLDEIERTRDIALRRFYLRRFARLMPALVAMVLVCNCFFLGTGTYGELKSSILALTYLTNYGTVFVGHHIPGYGYTWTLAVEEHFYLAWPVLLLALWRRYSPVGVLKATLSICVGVLLWRTLLSVLLTDERILYVGSIERADALLYGCAGAMAIRLGWRPPKILFYIGLILIAAYTLTIVPGVAVQSALLAIGSTFVLVSLDTYATRARQVLGFKAMAWIGVMSYGIYLWHGPMFNIARRFGFVSWDAKIIVTLLSVAVAYGSYRYLETPIRNFVRRREESRRLAFGTVPPAVPVASLSVDAASSPPLQAPNPEQR